MPSIEIDYTRVESKLQAPSSGETTANSQLISTPDGLAILEIQGTLNLPTKITSDHETISLDDIKEAVNIGKLTIEGRQATLYIGTSQRLIGTVEKIDPPFGLLKFPPREQKEEEEDVDVGAAEKDRKVEMVSVIERKVVFKHRPLPIM